MKSCVGVEEKAVISGNFETSTLASSSNRPQEEIRPREPRSPAVSARVELREAAGDLVEGVEFMRKSVIGSERFGRGGASWVRDEREVESSGGQ